MRRVTAATLLATTIAGFALAIPAPSVAAPAAQVTTASNW